MASSSKAGKTAASRAVWFEDEYDMKEELGKGAFSVVRRCIHKSTGKEIAAKIFDVRKLTVRDFSKLEREVRICKKLQHPNIVRLHQTIEEPNYHYLIFDLVVGGELFDDIVAREYYGEADAANYIYQIFDSLNFCHQHGIVHRDVKPENLLLDKRGPDAIIKLADFGLALEIKHDRPEWYGFSGTPGYLSPEVIKRQPYTKPVDVWACGVILYILLIGYPPFWDDDYIKLYEQIKRADYCYPSPEWDFVTSDAKNLIDKILVTNQYDRITINEALKHPFMVQRERIANTVHRQETLDSLRKFNARRKLKGAIMTTMAFKRVVNSMATGIKGEQSNNQGDAADLLKLTPQEQIIHVTEQILKAIDNGNYINYMKLCAPHLTTFAPETLGNIVEGTEFHKFYFETLSDKSYKVIDSKLLNSHVHMLNENAACIVYVRLTQYTDHSGETYSSQAEETRVWQRIDNQWKNVHFHRSNSGKYNKDAGDEAEVTFI